MKTNKALNLLFKYGFGILALILSGMTLWCYINEKDLFGITFGLLALFCLMACVFELLIYHLEPKKSTDKYDKNAEYQSRKRAFRVIQGGKR